MSEKTDVTTRESTPVQGSSDRPRESSVTLRPPVNVYEDAEGITLEADIPGVTKDRLELRVDKDSLLVEGDISFDMPEGIEAMYADIRAMRWSRSFTLSRELDTDAIDASLTHGVLRLRIPKRAEVRPRKVEVRTG